MIIIAAGAGRLVFIHSANNRKKTQNRDESIFWLFQSEKKKQKTKQTITKQTTKKITTTWNDI